MAAFHRRTSFAAPFIVTLATSCSGGKQEPPKPPARFPGQTWAVTMQPTGCRANDASASCPEGATCNPPPPREVACPPGSSGQNQVRIGELPDRSCAVVPTGCVELACATVKTACPLPVGEKLKTKLAFIWHIEKRGDACHAEESEEDCPKGVDCNPPAPRTMPCPPGASEDKDVLVAELPDGTCAIVPEGCTDSGCVGATTPCPQK